ncbi:MAG: ferritin family protein, partial [Dehalococcoidales bacterium]|nr:ferritin family protein [Dehalococcoidales bacterium]
MMTGSKTRACKILRAAAKDEAEGVVMYRKLAVELDRAGYRGLGGKFNAIANQEKVHGGVVKRALRQV